MSTQNTLSTIQNTIGYSFKKPGLLHQAFIRRSASEEREYEENNEVLEFIGDKALDLAVIKIMIEQFGSIEKTNFGWKLCIDKFYGYGNRHVEGILSDIKKDLVQRRTLANSITSLGFQNYLVELDGLGNSELFDNVQEQDSVKEQLFEAIIGAVALDCEWDIEVVTDVVKTMIDFDAYFENDGKINQDYVSLLQEWCQEKNYENPKYSYKEEADGFKASVVIEERDIIGESEILPSKSKARMAAAKKAYAIIESKGLLPNLLTSAISEPEKPNAIRQLNEMYAKKLIPKAEYKFDVAYDNGGNPIWTALCSVEGHGQLQATDYNKRVAQRDAAYAMLCKILNK